MNLDRLQQHWDEFGRRDPLWAILTVDDRRNRRWDPVAFFKTGQDEIDGVMKFLETFGLPRAYRKALDFGCGVGRLTQALCQYFDRSAGVDIAPSMIKQATAFNRYGDKCQYILNISNDLRSFDNGEFDLIYSVIVLQHMRPEYSRNYMREFLRVLSPGGVCIFQIPSELILGTNQVQQRSPKATKISVRVKLAAFVNPMQRLYRRLTQGFFGRSQPKLVAPVMEMHAVPRREVEELIERNAGQIVHVAQDSWAGPSWLSYTYYVTKDI